MKQGLDFERRWEYEELFHHTSHVTRFDKILAHYELFKESLNVPGHIVECGVFRGVSLIQFATFRELLCSPYSRKIVGFDTFGQFPATSFEPDQKFRDEFIKDQGAPIAREDLQSVLNYKNIAHNIELVEGDINETVPEYCKANPELKISLLHIDVDIYEPTNTILEYFYPRVVRGGIIVLDDYGSFPGETKAVDDFISTTNLKILRLPFNKTPAYIIKE